MSSHSDLSRHTDLSRHSNLLRYWCVKTLYSGKTLHTDKMPILSRYSHLSRRSILTRQSNLFGYSGLSRHSSLSRHSLWPETKQTLWSVQLPIVFFMLPSANNQLFIANCLLPITNCWLPVTIWPNNISISSQYSYELDSIELHSCLASKTICRLILYFTLDWSYNFSDVTINYYYYRTWHKTCVGGWSYC